MPPKKKKTPIKKPARPIASVSVPSKKVEEEPVQDANLGDPSANETDEIQGANDGDGKVNGDGATKSGDGGGVVKEFDEREVEEQYIRSLAEKIRPSVDKEVAKAMKVYDYERRLSKTLPQFIWQDDKVEAKAVDAARESEKGDIKAGSATEKEITKALVIYRTLLELNFPHERAEECMRKVRNLDLDDCFDWLFLYCSEDELLNADNPKHPEFGPDLAPSSLLSPTANSSTPLTPSASISKSFSSLSAPRTPSLQPPKTPLTPTPVVIPPTPTAIPASVFSGKNEKIDQSSLDPDLKSRILNSALQAENDEANELEDDPNAKYVRTKFKIEALKALGRKKS
ncbi:hypothetical protein BT69DRAFT_1343956, partial [Atractiella rhizophila]